jgi:hypothetical protein
VVLGTLIAAVAIVSSERSWLTWTAIMYVGLLIICGHIVWTWWGYFSRPLLPFHALAIAALAPRTRSSSQP